MKTEFYYQDKKTEEFNHEWTRIDANAKKITPTAD
jgi:hypothetical protein